MIPDPKIPTPAAAQKVLRPVTNAPVSLAKPISMADLQLTAKSRLLLVGSPGSGKTVIGCMLPTPIIFDLDNNIQGPIRYIQQNNLLTKEEMSKIVIVRPFLDSNGELIKRSERWSALGRSITACLKDYPDCKTIFLDSLSALTTAAKDEVRKQEKLYIAEGELGETLQLDKTIDAPMRINDWGSFATLLEQFFIRLSAKDKFICVTAHVKDEEVGKDTGIFKTFIACPGETREKLAGSFDECWYVSRETTGLGASAVSKVNIMTAAGGSKSPLGLKTAKQLGAQVKIDLPTVRSWFK